jgi:hypothetical protein
MTLKFQKGIFTCGKNCYKTTSSFWGVLDNFEINCTYYVQSLTNLK